jgi:hypothetical protein
MSVLRTVSAMAADRAGRSGRLRPLAWAYKRGLRQTEAVDGETEEDRHCTVVGYLAYERHEC